LHSQHAELRASASAAEAPARLLRLLIVIPTLDEVRQIEQVLSSLLADLPSAAAARVVVVDGGSTDGTVELVRAIAEQHPELSLLHNPARIQSAAVNLAARTFGHECDVLIRCDAHSVYPPRFCERLLSTLTRLDVDSVVVPLDSIGDSPLQQAVAWVSDSCIGSGGSPHRAGRASGFVDHGHHAAFRMDTFRRCGGYDETFSHNEDGELDCRQRALGARIYLDSEIRVGYRPRRQWRALFRQYFKYGVGRSRTVSRHPDSLRARQLAVPLNLLLSALALAVSPWYPVSLLWPALYVAVLCGTSLTLAVRKRALAGLLAGPAAAVMHTAWGFGFIFGLCSRREPVWRVGSTLALCDEDEGKQSARATVPRRLHALLVDPSLFTAPYDAALNQGLLRAGVQPTWAVRPIRRGERQELAAEYVDAFFYRRVDDVAALPRPARAAAKGIAHVWGLLALTRRVRQMRPDVVHFQWLAVPLFDALAIAFIRRSCPVVITVHDTVAFNGDSPSLWQGLASDLPLRLADRLIVHTRSGQDTLLRRGVPADKLAVIPHGPLSLGLPPTRTPRARAHPLRTFVLFGEIKHYKGLDVLLDALALLPKAVRAEARFVVAGRPRMDLGPTLAQIESLGLRECLELRPRRLSEQEMADLFAEADCFLFPYRQIDASGVYFLVKSWKRWIIASRLGIFAEDLADGEQGELVPPEDPEALATAIAAAIIERRKPTLIGPATSWLQIGAATHELYVRLGARSGVAR
jgi:succinoglycan biosynthesis protein ExoA